MLHTPDIIKIQQLKINIALFLDTGNDIYLDEINFINNNYSQQDFNIFIGNLLSYIITAYSPSNKDNYGIIITKFLNESSIITSIFNDEITKEDLSTLMNTVYIDNSTNNSKEIADFINENKDILSPFKNITFTAENLEIILTYMSKILTLIQSISYKDILNCYESINKLHVDAQYFISQKASVGLE